MTVEDAPGTVALYSRGRSGLLADDAGITVRRFRHRDQRFAWSEISYFADGVRTAESGVCWALDIVLRAGGSHSVDLTQAQSPAPETLAAVRQVAERYGITADLTGIMMKDGRPPFPDCLYEDPGGQAGVRYWDGTRWSPLLPASPRGARPVHKSTGRWVDLPVAPEPWVYFAVNAERAATWFRVGVALTVAGIVAGIVAGLWSGNWDIAGVFFAAAGLPVVFVLPPAGSIWFGWHRLDKTAKAPPPVGNEQLHEAQVNMPPADEPEYVYGVPIQGRPVRGRANPVVTGFLICAVVSGPLAIVQAISHAVPHALVVIGTIMAALPVVVMGFGGFWHDKLGAADRRILFGAGIVGLIAVCILSVAMGFVPSGD